MFKITIGHDIIAQNVAKLGEYTLYLSARNHKFSQLTPPSELSFQLVKIISALEP